MTETNALRELLAALRAAGVRRYKSPDFEVEFGPPVPVAAPDEPAENQPAALTRNETEAERFERLAQDVINPAASDA